MARGENDNRVGVKVGGQPAVHRAHLLKRSIPLYAEQCTRLRIPPKDERGRQRRTEGRQEPLCVFVGALVEERVQKERTGLAGKLIKVVAK